MRRVVSLFLPHWSTDRLRRKTGKPRPDAAIPARPLVTAIPDHGRRIVAATCADARALGIVTGMRSEEHTSELQSLMRISYAVFCLKKKKKPHTIILSTKATSVYAD